MDSLIANYAQSDDSQPSDPEIHVAKPPQPKLVNACPDVDISDL